MRKGLWHLMIDCRYDTMNICARASLDCLIQV
jgi:hypothetical protein